MRIGELVAPARLRLAYPGAWLRDDVYAIHGHYLDLHSTTPTFERLAAGAMARWVVHLPERDARPDDYEAALAPLYAFLHQLTQRSDHAAVSAGAGASARAWVALAGEGREQPSRPRRGARRGLRRRRSPCSTSSGSGPSTATSPAARCAAAACTGCARCCCGSASTAPYVLFGHTHRSGPWPQDDPVEWTTPAGLAAGQHGLVGLPAALPLRGAERLAVLARHGGGDRRRRAAAARPPARRPLARGASPARSAPRRRRG